MEYHKAGIGLLFGLAMAGPCNAADEVAYLKPPKTDEKDLREIIIETMPSVNVTSISQILKYLVLHTNDGLRIVNLTPDFIPPFIEKSDNRDAYFDGGLSFQKRAELGLLYDFGPSRMLLYLDSANPLEGMPDVFRDGKFNRRMRQDKSFLESLEEKLRLEKFMVEGNSLTDALKSYQDYHHLLADGIIGQETAGHLLLSYDNLADIEHLRFRDFFMQRMYYATRIINPEELSRSVDMVLLQLGLDTSQNFSDNIGKYIHSKTGVANVLIPENYLETSMDLRVRIKKDRNNMSRGVLSLYQSYGGEDIALFETDRIILGGKKWVGSVEDYKNFGTPSGRYAIKTARVLPRWIPTPSIENSSRAAREPGIRNALGLYAFELEGGGAIRIHSTFNTAAFNTEDQVSYGCIRVQPAIAMKLFDFVLHGAGSDAKGYSWYKGDVFGLAKSVRVVID